MNPFPGHTVRAIVAGSALLALSGVTLSSLSSQALFTDTVAGPAAAVTWGSVTLALGGTASTSLAVTAMAPGDARFGVVSVAGSGSLQSRYAARAVWSTADTLTSTMTLSVREIAQAGGVCDATLGWGVGDLATNRSAVTGQETVALFGDPASGAQQGDRVLDAGSTEHLCVRMALPSSAGNEVAGISTALRLEFAAEQTAHNA